MPAPEIATLSRRIAEALADDGYERQAIHDRLAELREALREQRADAPARILDAAIVLLESFESLPPDSGEVALGIIHSLVAKVESQLEPAKIQLTRWAPNVAASTTEIAASLARESSAPAEDVILGQILVNLGVVKSNQVDLALDIQKEQGIRIGEALIRMGAVTPKHVQRALRIQHHLRHGNMPPSGRADGAPAAEESPPPPPPADSAGLIGEIFVQLGFTTPDKVAAALKIQRATGLRLGEALAEMGAVTWDQVRQAVEAQRNIAKIPGGSIRL
jgi:hypothetical protein